MRWLSQRPCNQNEQSNRSRQHQCGAEGTRSEYQTASENALNISAVPAYYIMEVITYQMDLGMVGERREGREQIMLAFSIEVVKIEKQDI